MEQIKHNFVQANGLKLHVAEIGTGPVVVVFLHGFPEIWYSWRHQMIAVANAGYRAIAPDYRGYGLSDPPPEPEKATFDDLANDTLAILDFLDISKVQVFKDPRCMKNKKIPQSYRFTRGTTESFGRYMKHPKSSLNQALRKELVKYTFTKEGPPLIDFLPHPLGWQLIRKFTDSVYLYECPSNYGPQRKLNERPPSSTVPKIEGSALLIMGEKDYILKFTGMEDYIRSGQVKHFVPNLEIKYLPEGTHFVQEQSPDEVNQLILTFLGNNTST